MTNPLHSLPTELRIQIFTSYCLNWNGQTPNLIKALRPDPKLYHEALEILYRNNAYRFHKRNGWSFGDMKKEAALTILKVLIDVEPAMMKQGLWEIGSSDEESQLTPSVPTLIANASNIRAVTLHYDGCSSPEIFYGGVAYSFIYFLVPFKYLTRVELIMSVYRAKLVTYRGPRTVPPKLDRAIQIGNSRFGAYAKLSTVWALHKREEPDDLTWTGRRTRLQVREEWFWQAEDGNFLGK